MKFLNVIYKRWYDKGDQVHMRGYFKFSVKGYFVFTD